jgi:hypothetical protein
MTAIQNLKKGDECFVLSVWDEMNVVRVRPCIVTACGKVKISYQSKGDGSRDSHYFQYLNNATSSTRIVTGTEEEAIKVALAWSAGEIARDIERLTRVSQDTSDQKWAARKVDELAKMQLATPNFFVGDEPAGWSEQCAERANIWGNYRTETRTEYGSAAHRNRARYTGEKVHKLRATYVVGIVDESKEDPKANTFGATFMRTRKPVLFSCGPCCGTTNGQHAGAPIAGLTAAHVTCSKCAA